MSDMKRCVQCGLLKDVQEFRLYTYSRRRNTSGRYRLCKDCEAINSRYVRAKRLVFTATPELKQSESYATALETIEKTEQLYILLRSKNLRVPEKKHQEESVLDKLLEFHSAPSTVNTVVTETKEEALPSELASWLSAEIDDWLEQDISPEYLQETVYESLKAKYRPQTGIDRETFIPLYDDTYKDALNSILRKFDDYEEFCSSQESEEDDVQV